jgi:DNA processing protein
LPLRNRIIAGLCRAVIVVEAAVTGRALITATLAMEYGISMFAVPGDIDRETSVS